MVEKKDVHFHVSKRMKGNKAKDTKPELTLRKLLWERKIRGYRVCYNGLVGKPDVVFTKWKIAIFIHGCFWHVCPECKLKTPLKNNDFWSTKLKRNQERDIEVLASLNETGWEVLTVWECKLRKEPEAQISLVTELLKKIKNIKKNRYADYQKD